MAIRDKNNALIRLQSDAPVAIELGCGMNKRHTDAIGIDTLDYPCVGVVCVVEFILSHSSNSTFPVTNFAANFAG